MEKNHFSHADVCRAATTVVDWRIGLRRFGTETEQAAARASDEALALFMLDRARSHAARPYPGGEAVCASWLAEAEHVAAVLGIAA